MAKTRTTTDAAEILARRFFSGKPGKVALLEEERANAAIARGIYALRKKAKLTQAQLAKLVGTTTSVISRLEDADYRGHSLSILQRIAAAVGKRVDIRFVPAARKQRAA
jgi:DNA-binding XRE family transcriptional regulator